VIARLWPIPLKTRRQGAAGGPGLSEVVGFVELPGVPTRCGRAGFRLGFVYAGAGTVSIEVGRNVMASRLRFCAIAVSKNSSRAPLRPRSRSRSTRRMCFMWANRISTFFRSRRERRYLEVLPSARATSLRCGPVLMGNL